MLKKDSKGVIIHRISKMTDKTMAEQKRDKVQKQWPTKHIQKIKD